MATMVKSDAKNMTIAPRKVASQNIREQINNKTRQDIALGQVFTGIVEGRKSPKHDLYLGTDGYYANKFYYARQAQNFENQLFPTSK